MLYEELTVHGIFVGIKGEREKETTLGLGAGSPATLLTEIGGQGGRKGDSFEPSSIATVVYGET